MEAVSKLYTEAETRRRALQPIEKPLISMKDAEETVRGCQESIQLSGAYATRQTS
jgi:hypothetical protein